MHSRRLRYSMFPTVGLIVLILGTLSRSCLAQDTVANTSHKPRLHTQRIYNSDDRQPVSNTSVLPFSAIGLIDAQWGREANYTARTGTGVLISDRVVLSCAHVVFDSDIGWARTIQFTPGKNGSSEPFGIISVEKAVIQEGWLTDQDDDDDLSLLLLKTSIGQQAGTMTVAVEPTSFFSNAQLNITGYPGDLQWDQMFSAAGETFGTDGNLIQHYVDGGPGQSGSPMWFQDGNGHDVTVGVYTGDVDVLEGGRVVDTYSIGVRINTEFCQWINDFLAANDPTAQVDCDGSATVSEPSPLCGSGAGGMIPIILATLGIVRRRWSC